MQEAAEEEEEEAVDYQEVMREKCGELAKCSSLREKLDTCNERVSGKSNTTEDCTEELFDFVHCIDHCVSCGGRYDCCGICRLLSNSYIHFTPVCIHRWQRIYSRN